jgi:hypothetical protein
MNISPLSPLSRRQMPSAGQHLPTARNSIRRLHTGFGACRSFSRVHALKTRQAASYAFACDRLKRALQDREAPVLARQFRPAFTIEFRVDEHKERPTATKAVRIPYPRCIAAHAPSATTRAVASSSGHFADGGAERLIASSCLDAPRPPSYSWASLVDPEAQGGPSRAAPGPEPEPSWQQRAASPAGCPHRSPPCSPQTSAQQRTGDAQSAQEGPDHKMPGPVKERTARKALMHARWLPYAP